MILTPPPTMRSRTSSHGQIRGKELGDDNERERGRMRTKYLHVYRRMGGSRYVLDM
jgi:hypothetical protein